MGCLAATGKREGAVSVRKYMGLFFGPKAAVGVRNMQNL